MHPATPRASRALWFLAAIALLATATACDRSREAGAAGASRTTAAQQGATSAAADSVRQLVQAFYDWYVPQTNGPASESAYDSALTVKAAFFTPSLLAALREDNAAQDRDTTGDIVSVGADYDPFLNSQDPCDHYEVGEVVPTAEGFAASVYGNCAGARHERADVVLDLRRSGGTWQVANFRDPGNPGYDLVSELARVKAEWRGGDAAPASRDSAPSQRPTRGRAAH